jgi:hypothetical protein
MPETQSNLSDSGKLAFRLLELAEHSLDRNERVVDELKATVEGHVTGQSARNVDLAERLARIEICSDVAKQRLSALESRGDRSSVVNWIVNGLTIAVIAGALLWFGGFKAITERCVNDDVPALIEAVAEIGRAVARIEATMDAQQTRSGVPKVTVTEQEVQNRAGRLTAKLPKRMK